MLSCVRVCFHMCALMFVCALTLMFSYVCGMVVCVSYYMCVCSQVCALICAFSCVSFHMYVLRCVPSCGCSHMCAFVCVCVCKCKLLFVCSRVCFLSVCVLMHMLSEWCALAACGSLLIHHCNVVWCVFLVGRSGWCVGIRTRRLWGST